MPDLILRLREDDGSTTAAVVTVEPSHTVADLALALAEHRHEHGDGQGGGGRVGHSAGHLGDPAVLCLMSERVGRELPPDAAVDDVDLLTGDVLRLGSSMGDRTGDVGGDGVPAVGSGVRTASFTIDVVAGPDAGRAHPVEGLVTIGRDTDNTLRLADPSVSRRHAVVTVGPDGRPELVPDGRPANGVRRNGTEIDGPIRPAPHDVIALGGTRIVIRPTAGPPPTRRRRFGHLDVQRTPYRPRVVTQRDVDPFGPIPDRPDSRRLQVVAVLAPLLAGLVLFVMWRQVQFLLLTLVSPFVAIGTVLEERRSGRRSVRVRVGEFRSALDARRHLLERWREEERSERWSAAPDLVDIVRRAERRSTDLWERHRASPDFLTVRLGLGSDRTTFAVEVADGGDDDLRAEAVATLAGLDRLADVPITVDLTADAVLAVHGDPTLVAGSASSLLVQAATLHSPDDLVVCAAVAPRRGLGWSSLLPHTRSVTSPVGGDHLAATAQETDLLLARLLDVVAFRSGCDSERGWSHQRSPHLLVVLDAALGPDPVLVARLLDAVANAGISVIWLADDPSDLPRQASRVFATGWESGAVMAGRLWSTDPAVADVAVEVEQLRAEIAERAASALAPLRDASSASAASAIPRAASLLEVLGVGRPTPAWVIEHWSDPGDGLRFPIGLGADGPVEIDLVVDGPHLLIGGTSGSGKSELLQSMVATLAVRRPPSRLNFLFVDYKGGASSHVFGGLPHTVGSVTDLDGALANRVLVSLRAELRRRMALLEGRAKDLAELRSVAPDDAPPSLVIVVDEFATLVKEVPDFVTGIVDIAQRGRSLGIHLVLATQRPSGSVDENILANTNLRIALRVVERSESTAILGVPDAADIPVPLRGRALVRLGPRRVVEFQSSYGGAPLAASAIRPAVVVRSPVAVDGAAINGDRDRDGPSQLGVLVDAVVEAGRRLDGPPPRRPWRDPLPVSIALDEVGAAWPSVSAGRFVPFGVLDDPERQEQRPARLDLDAGGCLVFGAGGSGVTTLLTTIAVSALTTGAPGSVAVVGFDAAGGDLAGLRGRPGVIDVADADDLEAVTRHLGVLDAELDRRRILATAGGARLRFGPTMPRLLLVVDGVGPLVESLADAGGAADVWIDRFHRLAVEGRRAGIHPILAADRRAAVSGRVFAALGDRIVLRQADDVAAAELGLPRGAAASTVPGRGWFDGAVVQVATPPGRTSVPSDVRRDDGASVLRSRPLEDVVDAGELPAAARPFELPFGRTDLDGAVATLDLSWCHATVCGPPRSGRSVALATVASSAVRAGADVVVLGPASSPLSGLDGRPGVVVACGGPERWRPLLDPIVNSLDDVVSHPRRRVLLVVDDVDRLDDPELAGAVSALSRHDHVRLVASLDTGAMTGYTSDVLVDLARRSRRLLVLRPDDPAEFLQATGIRLAVRPGLRWVPGRGVFVADRVPTVVQVAAPARSPVPA